MASIDLTEINEAIAVGLFKFGVEVEDAVRRINQFVLGSDELMPKPRRRAWYPHKPSNWRP